MLQFARAAMILIPLAIACSARSVDSTAPTRVCPGALGTAEEIAATPRADADAEWLALSLGDRLTADPATYARVSSDLTAIRALAPDVAGLHVRREDATVTLTVEDGTSLRRDRYHNWDCLNDHYGLVSIAADEPSLSGVAFAFVRLKGRYATDLIACGYARLPHVAYAEASGLIGDGSTINVFAEGEVFHYVFDHAGGDCPAGCTTHVASHFTTNAKGVVARVDTYDNAGGAAEPDWLLRGIPRPRPFGT